MIHALLLIIGLTFVVAVIVGSIFYVLLAAIKEAIGRGLNL